MAEKSWVSDTLLAGSIRQPRQTMPGEQLVIATICRIEGTIANQGENHVQESIEVRISNIHRYCVILQQISACYTEIVQCANFYFKKALC